MEGMPPIGPFGGDSDPELMELVETLNDRGKMATVLNSSKEGQPSTAEIMADIINDQRADHKMLAKLVGIDVKTNEMTSDHAAELLAGIKEGEGYKLVRVFNDLAAIRDQVLREIMDKDEYEEYRRKKDARMYSDSQPFEHETEEENGE